MIEIFHDREDADSHIKFHRWRQQHRRDGYYLNYRGPSNTRLHRAKCPHLSNQDWDIGEKGPNGSMTKTKKICSTNRQELEYWAREKGVKPKRCPDC